MVRDGKLKQGFGAAGYRSPYLSHAKRALYHLSYSPAVKAKHGHPDPDPTLYLIYISGVEKEGF